MNKTRIISFVVFVMLMARTYMSYESIRMEDENFLLKEDEVNSNNLIAGDNPTVQKQHGTRWGGGNGTLGNPYQIVDVIDLQNMSANLSAHYILNNDIDASETKTWNGGEGFSPIGNDINPFTGSLDGNGYNITNLHIDRYAQDYVGLFGYIDTGAIVVSVGLVDVFIKGDTYIGGLTGYFKGSIDNSYVTGEVRGTNFLSYNTGGMVGYNLGGTISNSHFSGLFNGGSNSIFVGGLVGSNGGSITYSHTTGVVQGNWTTNMIGGLVGYNTGSITYCFSTADVPVINGPSGSGGGLVGDNRGIINNSFSTGAVSGPGRYSGLVGENRGGEINNSYSTGSVSGSVDVGGLVGNNTGTITNSYSTGVVSGNKNVGGLIGWDNGSVTNCFWDNQTSGWTTSAKGTQKNTADMMKESTFSGWDFTVAGDGTIGTWIMAGYPHLQLEHTTAIENVVDLQLVAVDLTATYLVKNDISASQTSIWNGGAGFIPLGGGTPFVGTFDGNGYNIIELYINRSSENFIGLFGWVNLNAVITGVGLENVDVTGNNDVGSLVGYNQNGYITKCYTTGTVKGTNFVGGLVGESGLSINNSYSTCSVEGSDRVGGLTGFIFNAEIINCYSTGFVTGSGGWVGGLLGQNSGGTISDCFWDNETSGTTSSDGGTGKATMEMRRQSTFTNWDFVDVWGIYEENTYPFLTVFGFPPLPSADIEITVEDSLDVLNVGETLHLFVNVTNHGPDNALTVVVIINLSYEVSYVSDNQSAIVVGNNLTWNIGTFYVGKTFSCDVEVTVDSEGTGTANTIASVSSTTSDPGFYANITSELTYINRPPTANNDFFFINEDIPLIYGAPGVLINDTDPDFFDSLTVITFENTSLLGITVLVNPDGSFTYDTLGYPPFQTLGVGQSQVDSFNYTTSDGYNRTSNATVTVTIFGVNDKPMITTTNLTIASEDILYERDYNATDIDTGDVLTWSMVSNASWLDIDSTTGVLFGIPDNGDVGWFWVEVTVGDDHGGNHSYNFTLTVNNTPPLITSLNPPAGVNEDDSYYYGFESNDDGQGNVTWTFDKDADWLTMNKTTGILSGTPDNSHVGSYWVNVTVHDGNGGTNSINFTITVNNTPPSITSLTPPASVLEDTIYSYDFSSNDDGQGTMTWSRTTDAGWLSINETTGVLSGIPDNSQVQSFWVNVSVDDGNGGTGSFNFSITVDNILPLILNPNPPTIVYEDDMYSYNFESDEEGEGATTWTIYTIAGWLTIDGNTGVLSGTPDNSDVGGSWVNVTFDDGNGGSAFFNFTLIVFNVNDPPTITTSDKTTAIINEDYFNDYDASDIDPTVDTLTWSLSTNASWLSIDSGNGHLTGTPTNMDIGSYWVNVTVADGNGGTDSHDFIMTVSGVNNAPVIETVTPRKGVDGRAYILSINASDLDGDELTWSLYSNASWLDINQAGTLWGTPTGSGTYWVNISVDDGLLTNTLNLSITIEPDLDGDGISDADDTDMDGDGVLNVDDRFPSDPEEWLDTDSDSVGNNADLDDDDDGWNDNIEIEAGSDPLDDTSVPLDSDGDGNPDSLDEDDDDDGVVDTIDEFPQDPNEWEDTDGDGTGNNEDFDDDGDGWNDTIEIETGSDPLDNSSIPLDTDDDGTPDILDPDDDNDYVPDDLDDFPLDETENTDTDGDGTGNNADADDDGDGWNDTIELDAGSSPIDNSSVPVDTNDNGIPDILDDDDDGDGVPDISDAFPLDKNEDSDNDGDGVGDNADIDDDNDGMPDSWETEHSLDPLDDADAAQDGDGDGLSNLAEYMTGTLPSDADSDDDEIPDGWEVLYGLDPNDPSDAGDDGDGDGFSNLEEYKENSDPNDSASIPKKAEKEEADYTMWMGIILALVVIIILLIIMLARGKLSEELPDEEIESEPEDEEEEPDSEELLEDDAEELEEEVSDEDGWEMGEEDNEEPEDEEFGIEEIEEELEEEPEADEEEWDELEEELEEDEYEE